MARKLVELAKRAGVSPATVSLVYSGSPLVARKTREKVKRAGEKMGYYPNAAARAVRRGKFNRIAAVVVQYGPRGTTYAPSSSYFDTAADKLADHGYSLVFEPMHLIQFIDEFVEPPKLFRELAVDGVLAMPATGYVPAPLDEQLRRMGAPVVWVNRKPVPGVECVFCDEAAGGRMLARHLIELGHRRIGYLGFKGLHYTVTDRYRGVREEIERAGLDTSNLVLAEREASMVDEADRLLDAESEVTAVICYQRRGYQAMIHMAADRGIRVPQELSICYFASAWELPGTDFPVTCVEVPEPRMAESGVEILLKTINGQEAAEIPRAVAGVLRLGMSTGPAGDP